MSRLVSKLYRAAGEARGKAFGSQVHPRGEKDFVDWLGLVHGYRLVYTSRQAGLAAHLHQTMIPTETCYAFY